jgi:hypothetical protein
VLEDAKAAINAVPQAIMKSFQKASGLDSFAVHTGNAPDLYAEIAAEENKKAEARDDN